MILADSLQNNQGPIVALESTVLTHGMPFPQNVETAMELEEIIRQEGAHPATIGVIEGTPIVGLTSGQIKQLGEDKSVIKIASRDIPLAITRKKSGGTTVSGTLALAHKAGLKFFATGGIGGVHRDSFDVSADLYALANYPLAVICSGAKSLLDLPKTIELLESLGVPILGNETNQFPAFTVTSSGLPCPQTDLLEQVEFLIHHWNFLRSGIVIGNPIPREHALDEKREAQALNRALEMAKEQNITGPEVTPFLLKEVKNLTKGESLKSNIELIKNNARHAAKLALAYSRASS